MPLTIHHTHLEHGLSVIEPVPYSARKKRTQFPSKANIRESICIRIDEILASRPKDFSEFLDKLKKQDETYKEYLEYIANVINSSYDGAIHELIDRKNGTPNEEEIINRFSDAIAKEIVNDDEATDTLINDPDGSARKAMSQRVKSEITALVPQFCKNRKFKRTKSFPTLNVAVTADELSNLPKESIHTCKLKFTTTSFNVRSDDADLSLPVQSIEDIIK